jgi:NOP5NT (NUC127) domain
MSSCARPPTAYVGTRPCTAHQRLRAAPSGRAGRHANSSEDHTQGQSDAWPRLQGSPTFLLFEAASGYSLFEVKDVDAVGLSSENVQASITDMARFSKLVTLLAFKPFTTAMDALEQVNAVSESAVTDMLVAFLKLNLPKVKEGKKAKFTLGVLEPKLASSVQEATSALSLQMFLRGCTCSVGATRRSRVLEPQFASSVQEATRALTV